MGTFVAMQLEGYNEVILNSRKDEKLFRDPIFGFQKIRPYEVLIIDSPIFQRLRKISQTALAYLTYPASIHSRFEHSINCLNLAQKILNSLENIGVNMSDASKAEVRLAALLHDVGHCIFSHASEFIYKDFQEIREALNDGEISQGNKDEGELINYCILMSEEFNQLLWQPIQETFKDNSDFDYLRNVEIEHVAQMIIGMAPNDAPQDKFLSEIINGPFDIDKLDYLTRDAYFTGISLSVDIDRLLPSLRVAYLKNPEKGDVEERRLVVDHRGIAVVEQLLFARMVLYDTVYHHHKVRAATKYFGAVLRNHAHKNIWPTPTGTIENIADLLHLDESIFFGHEYDDPELKEDVLNIKRRVLPGRSLVITPRALVDGEAYTIFTSRCADYLASNDPVQQARGQRFFQELTTKIIAYATEEGASGISEKDIYFDIPAEPKYDRLGRETLIQIVDDYVEPLERLFPFQKVVNNYATQYKYRTYLFSTNKYCQHVAYAAYRAFSEIGVKLNDLSLILAHQNERLTRELLVKHGIDILDWREDFFAPDALEQASQSSGA